MLRSFIVEFKILRRAKNNYNNRQVAMLPKLSEYASLRWRWPKESILSKNKMINLV